MKSLRNIVKPFACVKYTNLNEYITDYIWGIGVVNVSNKVRVGGFAEDTVFLIYHQVANEIKTN